MNKRILGWTLFVFFSMLMVLLTIEETNAFLTALIIRIFLFVKQNTLKLLVAFFLVKGKFILTLFLKKIAFLSAAGLSKRYLIEKVITHNLKIHFLDHISDDVKRLIVFIQKNFKDFPIIKQIITALAFLGSLSIVGKFMGGMLAMKVFLAKFWSVLLALVLKFSTVIVYFFTDYLWGSWMAPIVEVVIFSWILGWMEKIPFFQKYLLKIYKFFLTSFEYFEDAMETIFHIPLKRFFKFLTRGIKKHIYALIGYAKVSAWKRLREVRMLHPNKHHLLMKKRQKEKETKKKIYRSSRERLLEKRKKKNKQGTSGKLH